MSRRRRRPSGPIIGAAAGGEELQGGNEALSGGVVSTASDEPTASGRRRNASETHQRAERQRCQSQLRQHMQASQAPMMAISFGEEPNMAARSASSAALARTISIEHA